MGISLIDIGRFVPEFILAATVLLLLVGDLVIASAAKKRRALTGVALLGVLAAGLVLLLRGQQAQSIFMGQIAIDPISNLFKLLFVAVAVVSLITALLSRELPDRNMGEYYALLVSITFGMFLMASANDLLMAYLGIEMVSIVSYALAGYRLHDKRSSEAALKYVVYGGAASGIMLFGISLFYGLFGTTEFTAIHHAMKNWEAQHFAESLAAGGRIFPLTVITSFAMIFAGIGYKIAVVPFHMWSPDVYEGAPTPFTGFLSVGPKAAGFVLFMRMFIGNFVDPGSDGGPGFLINSDGVMPLGIDVPLPAMLGVVAAATMTFGNLAAIPQNNVKRLLAYSSIAHAGYLMLGFVVLSEAAIHAVSFYLVIYYLMNIGAFTVCQVVRDRTGGELLHDFCGLGTREPVIAIFMTIFLLSLTGLPPLAGFIGKFYLFAAVLERGGYWYVALAVLGVLNSAVSLYYYLKIARAMWLSEPIVERTPAPVSRWYTVITGALAIPTLILGLYWAPLSGSIRENMAFYRSPAPDAPIKAAAAPQAP